LQHGKPMQVIDMGQTEIDQETFETYLEEMRMHYTADKVRYHKHVHYFKLTMLAVSSPRCALFDLERTLWLTSLLRLQLQLLHK
jgi:hypothetical protein